MKKIEIDQALIAVSLLFAFFCGLILSNQNLEEYLFGRNKFRLSSADQIGQIIHATNDTRYKNNNSLIWNKTKPSQAVYIEDSIFTGSNSQMQVSLDNGDYISLDQNSLIKFVKSEYGQIPQLSMGNFRFVLKEKTKVLIDGQVTELNGKNSEIQINLRKNHKPQIKLLKGIATINNKKLIQNVTETEKPTQITTTEPTLPILNLKIDKNNYSYIYRLNDVYNTENELIFKKETINTYINTQIPIKIESTENKESVFLHLSSETEAGKTIVINQPMNQNFISNAFVGKNLLAISIDGQSITNQSQFYVHAQYLSTKPIIRIKNKNLTLSKNEAVLFFLLKNKIYEKYQMELSNTTEFLPRQTYVYPITKLDRVILRAPNQGTYYVKVIGINKHDQLSIASDIQKITIRHTPQIFQKLTQNQSDKTNEKAQRKISSNEESKITAKKELVPPEYINRNFDQTKWTIDLGGNILFSRVQLNQNAGNSINSTLGIRYNYNTNNHGIETAIKGKTTSVSNGANTNTNPLFSEILYTYDFNRQYSPFSNLGRSRASLLLGIEYYSNNGTGPYLSQYTIGKVGIGFLFPLKMNWSTGGRIFIGQGSNNTKKYEILGDLNYFLNYNWSVGAGYRMYIIDSDGVTGITTSAYREGYLEGFSSIKWSY